MRQPVSNEEQRRLRTKHVLLVEDNEDEVTLFERALRASDLWPKLDVAPDVETAESFLFSRNGEVQGRRPDLVMVDMVMGEFS
jgi:hypothetical protein